tara:strand:+ start:7605 stop:8678 length:1074 start_codon:yes stop_codon:yes gene_type:complete
MKAALITDTHFGVRNDSQIFLDHFDKFYSNIFFPYLRENNIRTIFHLGDVVDRRKFINYVTLNEFKRIFVNPVVHGGYDFHALVGNHDIPYRNSNDINAMNELFDTYSIYIYSEPKDIKFDDVSITMMPWINSSNYHTCINHINNTNSQILFGHLELNGFEMHMGMKNHEGMDTEPFEKFDMVCSGHFHHKSSDGGIHYLGAPYEMTWHNYNDRHGFHIFDSEKRDLTFVQNPYRIFNKIWYDDSDVSSYEDMMKKYSFDEYRDTYVKVIVQHKNNPYWFDMVLDSLYTVNPANVSIVDDHKNLDKQSEEDLVSEAEDTLTSLFKYVDRMETDVDKVKLQQLFSNLYNEAQNMEVAS